jgi:hypothetical protein
MMMSPGKRSLTLISHHDIPTLDRKGLRHFGIVTGAMFVALFGLLFPWLLNLDGFPVWPWVVFGVLSTFALVGPELLRPVHYWWMRLALLLSRITTPLILGIIYFLLFTPMALAMRVLGKDPMRRNLDGEEATYRIKNVSRDPVDLEKPF